MDRATYERIHMRFRLVEHDQAELTQIMETTEITCFLQIPLHPSKLVPLQKDLPKNRPINTVLVQFSDESIRITPQVFEQLRNQALVVADEQLLRFEEDAFYALDTVNSPTSLLDAATAQEKMDTMSVVHSARTQVALNDLPSPESLESTRMQQMNHLPDESTVRMEELVKEREAWQERIQGEHRAMQRAKEAWESEQAGLKNTLKLLHTKQEQRSQIVEATRKERLECQRLELHLEAQRIRLVKELRFCWRPGVAALAM